jgi:hypothetical protein
VPPFLAVLMPEHVVSGQAPYAQRRAGILRSIRRLLSFPTTPKAGPTVIAPWAVDTPQRYDTETKGRGIYGADGLRIRSRVRRRAQRSRFFRRNRSVSRAGVLRGGSVV